MSIERLDIIIQKTLPLVYDDSLSYLEFLAKVVAKVNEAVDELNIYLNQDLRSYVMHRLEEWQADGTLDQIISDALTTGLDAVNDRVDNVVNNIGDRQYTEQNYVTNGETVTASIDAIDTTVASHVSEFVKHRNIFISDTPPNPEEGEEGDIFLVSDNVSGSFTPQILVGGVQTGVTHIDPTVGEFHRIGNMVFVSMTLIFTYSGSSTADVTITGLPFAIRNSGDKPALPVTQVRNISFPTNGKYLLAYPFADLVNGMELSFVVDGVSTVKLSGSNINKAVQNFIRIQGFYYTV